MRDSLIPSKMKAFIEHLLYVGSSTRTSLGTTQSWLLLSQRSQGPRVSMLRASLESFALAVPLPGTLFLG